LFFPILPLTENPFPFCRLKGYADSSPEGMFSDGKPFFNILTDNGIAAQFLEAVAVNPEDAMAFVSKHSVGAIDFDALRDILGHENRLCASWVQATYSGNIKNCTTRSVLLVDRDKNVNRLLHLHMIREPDRYGQWKIFGIDQE
jgi:hypothetical protein